MRLGFIGLGIMGRPMALNLLQAGHSLAIYARRPEAMEPLTQAGALGCSTPAEVARQADICFTMLTDTSDVEAVVLGAADSDDQSILAGIQRGGMVIDMSTIAASVTRRIAARLEEAGVMMLDAPVSGGEQGAIDGTLSIMVGGPEAAVERARPLFEVLGQRIVHVGAAGAGQVCKACNQVVVAQTIAGVAEALLFAQAAGVDPGKVREALLGGFANSRILEVHGKRMLDEDFNPGFKASLHQKDLRILLEGAYELGLAMPGTAQAQQWLNALVGQGEGDLDSAAIYRVLKQLSRS
ncbi:NAD(P)-dependent oxidoreductase [Halochromatium sp.]